MPNMFIFADEAGDFTFKRKVGASRFFVLCTVAASKWELSESLLAIRRSLALAGDSERESLHATSDLQEVRNVVFREIAAAEFRIDATILEKSKSRLHIRATSPDFYRHAWYYHFKHVGPKLARECDRMLITAAALGEKKTRAAFKAGVNDPIQQLLPRERWEVAFHDSAKDPLLWVADYCAWAIQRKWERGDDRSYALIQNKIASEYDLFRISDTHFY